MNAVLRIFVSALGRPTIATAITFGALGVNALSIPAAREAIEETAHPFRPTALLGVYVARSVPSGEPEGVTYVRFAFTGELGPQEPGRTLDGTTFGEGWSVDSCAKSSYGRSVLEGNRIGRSGRSEASSTRRR